MSESDTQAISYDWTEHGRPKRGNLDSCGGKNVRARLGSFHLDSGPEQLTDQFFSAGQTGQMGAT